MVPRRILAAVLLLASIAGGQTQNPGSVNVITTPWSTNWLAHADDAAAYNDLGVSSWFQTRLQNDTNSAEWAISNYIGTYNVRHYGAVGDGVTDDTAAIQAAIDAAGVVGGCVYLPEGEYVVTDSLNINSDHVTLQGAGMLGTTLKYDYANGNKSIVLIQDANYVTVSDLAIDVTNAAAETGCGAVQAKTGGSFITIAHVKVTGGTNAFSVEDPITDVHIHHCATTGQTRHAIREFGKARVYVHQNHFADSLRELIAFNAPGGSSVTDVWFTDNYLELGVDFSFIVIVSSTSPTYNRLHFDRNSFVDTADAENVFRSYGESISNSTFVGNTLTGGRMFVELRNGSGNVISNNIIDGCEEGGIVLFSESNDVVIGNVVKNCDQVSTTASIGGICLRSYDGIGSSNNLVTGNRCFDDQGTKTQKYGIYIPDTDCTGNVVVGNYLDGNLTSDFLDAGTDTTSLRYDDGDFFMGGGIERSIKLKIDDAGAIAGEKWADLLVAAQSATYGNGSVGGTLTLAGGNSSGSDANNGDVVVRAGEAVTPESTTAGGSVYLRTGQPSNSQQTGNIVWQGYTAANPPVLNTWVETDGSTGVTTFFRPVTIQNGSTSAGYIDLYEDSDYGTSKVRMIPDVNMTTDYTSVNGSLDLGDGTILTIKAGLIVNVNDAGAATWTAD